MNNGCAGNRYAIPPALCAALVGAVIGLWEGKCWDCEMKSKLNVHEMQCSDVKCLK